MKAEIISIGTELLLGHINNSNAAYIAQELAGIGLDLYHQAVVGDNPQRLGQALKQALKRSSVVITTGGLGPTLDDITSQIIAKILKKNLKLTPPILADIRKHFKSRKIKMPTINQRQAMIPAGSSYILNKMGTAPGLIIPAGKKKYIIALPGPPREMEPMMTKDIVPFLKKTYKLKGLIKSRLIKTTGLCESEMHKYIADLLELSGPVQVGIYAKLGEVNLKIMAKAKTEQQAKKDIAKIEKIIKKRIGGFIFGYDNETLEGNIGKLLRKKKRTLSVAESCTGGLLANRITNSSGSSDYFMGGMVTYCNISKFSLLGVPNSLIKRFGAVSKQVATDMAINIRVRFGTNIGIGITGIAGPGGGTKKKPAGTVHIAMATNVAIYHHKYRFLGSRNDVKLQATQAALDMIRRYLLIMDMIKLTYQP